MSEENKAEEVPFEATVWSTFVVLDVTARAHKMEVKNKDKTQILFTLSYLPWAVAWSILMENYPESSFDFTDPTVGDDKTVTVNCDVTIRKGEKSFVRSMWLPVMDHYNNAIPNPNARQISDTKMRCLVKTLALVGLGNKLYKGDGLPYTSPDEVTASDKLRIGLVATSLIKACEAEDSEQVDMIMSMLDNADSSRLFNGTPPEGFLKSKQKDAVGAQRHKFWSYLSDIKDIVIAEQDNSVVIEALSEMSPYAKRCLWGNLGSEEQTRVQSFKEDSDHG